MAGILAAALTLAALPAAAQGLVRDAEIERTLQGIAGPLFRAAMLNPASVHLYIVNDRAPNAFVTGGQNIFLHTGMLTELRSIDELRAVIAHETGHIAGGHVARRGLAMQGPRGIAAIGMLGALAAGVGGSPQAGVAIATGAGQVAQRSALAHSRAEEASADQAGLRYMAAAGSDPQAMLEVLGHFRGQEMLSARNMDPYARDHPMWSERMALIEERVAAMEPGRAPSDEDAYRHRRMVAKLDAFLDAPSETLRGYPDDGSEVAVMARAIAYHRQPDPDRALAGADALIALRPDDPYYAELKGQMLLETGRATEAAADYRRAVELAPEEPLILAGLGRALLNMNDDAVLAEARDALARSAEADRRNPGALRDLALAEARLGNEGAAALATAERFVIEGSAADAWRNAERAVALLPAGSPGWRRAQDVISMARRARSRE
jgi:predicted Zn-dependent protease